MEAVAFPLIVSRDATELITEISFLQKVMRLPIAFGADSAPLIHLTRSALSVVLRLVFVVSIYLPCAAKNELIT